MDNGRINTKQKDCSSRSFILHGQSRPAAIESGMPHISISNVSKTCRVRRKKAGVRFRRDVEIINALRDVGFDVDAGEIVGFIGPNGAGKSTTIKILSGILVPDSGRVDVLGRIPGVTALLMSRISA